MTATKYALVPVVATEEMRAIFRAERGSGTEFTHTVLQCADFDSRYFQMLAAAPPFVVTDEVVEKACAAYKAVCESDFIAEGAPMRAALEAVLGGWV